MILEEKLFSSPFIPYEHIMESIIHDRNLNQMNRIPEYSNLL